MISYHAKNLNNFKTILSDQQIWKAQMYHEHTIDNIMVFITKGISLTNFVHVKPKIH